LARWRRWYEQSGEVEWKRGGEKWRTLQHNGVIFPPLYEPHRVPLTYDLKDIVLPAECEEVASMFAAMLKTDYAQKEVFQKNFMKDWRRLLKKHKETEHIKEFRESAG
jgi:DNA topoisomerase-1